MNNIVLNFLEWAIINGWNIQKNSSNTMLLNTDVIERYSKVTNIMSFMSFQEIVSNCSTVDDCTWFLCSLDYNKKEHAENEFTWNEFEKMSIESTTDPVERAEIKKWWTNHLPVMISVKDGYSFFAISLEEDFGCVVQGFEPEFEDVVLVANSFEEFLHYIMIGKIQF